MPGHDNRGDGIDLGLLSNGLLVSLSNEKPAKENSYVKVWDPKTVMLVKSFSTQSKGGTSLLVLSDDRLAVGFQDGNIKLLDVETESILLTMQTCQLGRVLSMIELPNGHLVSCGSKRDATINIWDLDANELVESFHTGHSSDVWTLSLSSDAKFLASGSGDQKIKIWSL